MIDQFGPLSVFLNDSHAAFPFSKVSKQISDGVDEGESILRFFEVFPKAFGLIDERAKDAAAPAS